MGKTRFLKKIGSFLVGVFGDVHENEPSRTFIASDSAPKMSKKYAIKHRKQAKPLRMAPRRRRIRNPRPTVVARVRVYARPVTRREVMMPAPWSRVEKYKKVKKDSLYGEY